MLKKKKKKTGGRIKKRRQLQWKHNRRRVGKQRYYTALSLTTPSTQPSFPSPFLIFFFFGKKKSSLSVGPSPTPAPFFFFFSRLAAKGLFPFILQQNKVSLPPFFFLQRERERERLLQFWAFCGRFASRGLRSYPSQGEACLWSGAHRTTCLSYRP